MNRSLMLIAAAALLYAGCGPSNPMAPVPADDGKGVGNTVAVASEGGKVKLSGDNTKITFVGTKPDGKHEGGFKSLTGEIQMKTMQVGQFVPPLERTTFSDVSVEIDTDSLYSDVQKLTDHLKGDDFFKVKQHPKIKFKSTKVLLAKEGELEDVQITGDLTLLGVTKSISFPAKVTFERGLVHLTGAFKINRKDFGMTYGQGKVDNDVNVTFTVGEPAKAAKKA